MSKSKKQEDAVHKKSKQLSDDQTMEIARRVLHEDKDVLNKLSSADEDKPMLDAAKLGTQK